jgi:ATP-binding cassette subfamily B protein
VRALRLLPPFLRLVWTTRPSYAVAIVVLRLIQAFGPVAVFYVSKLVFDVLQEVLAGRLAIAAAWPRLVQLIALELVLAVQRN